MKIGKHLVCGDIVWLIDPRPDIDMTPEEIAHSPRPYFVVIADEEELRLVATDMQDYSIQATEEYAESASEALEHSIRHFNKAEDEAHDIACLCDQAYKLKVGTA
jgi:hypothetical protein